MGAAAREEIANVIARARRRVHAPATTSRTGTSTACSSRSQDICPVELRPRATSPRATSTATSSSTRSATTPSSSTTAREEELGDELMRALERYLLLQIIDSRWREHLYDMDYLREGIHLRGFAQIEPIVAYKNEAFTLFTRPDEHDLGRLRPHDLPRRGGDRGRERRRPGRASPVAAARAAGRRRPAGACPTRAASGTAQPSALAAAAAGGARPSTRAPRRPSRCPAVEQRRVDADEQIGRNDPCWCGVGQEVQEVPRRRRVAADASAQRTHARSVTLERAAVAASSASGPRATMR